MLPYHYYLQPQPQELHTLEEVSFWCAENGVKAYAEYRDERRSIAVKAENGTTVFTVPVLSSHLAWTLKGQP